MILIAANRWSRQAKALASRWQPHDVKLLTAQDLSTFGWRQHSPASSGNVVIAQGTPIQQTEITAVLTLMPCVFPRELLGIALEDRPYIASEMTAFLQFWLSSLSCPVLNRPTRDSLAGPAWTQEKWVHIAAQAGIPVQPTHRHASPSSTPNQQTPSHPLTTLTVIGKHILGEADRQLHLHARHLADLASVELLSVHFDSPQPSALFVAADPYPDLTDDKAADAALDLLQSRSKA